MARVRPDLFVHPHLGAALRHLRTRGAPPLRQADVAARKAGAGTGISGVWVWQLAAGKGHPTHATLDALLRALGSDRAELDRLLAERPWEVGEGGEWEERTLRERVPWPEPAAAATPPPPPTTLAPPPPPGPEPLAAEAAELGARFALLPPESRRRVLEEVRRLTGHGAPLRSPERR
jgi:hypothetical protein